MRRVTIVLEGPHTRWPGTDQEDVPEYWLAGTGWNVARAASPLEAVTQVLNQLGLAESEFNASKR